jgi:hypothetical protein
MPNRILREAILSSEAVAKLKPAEEVFYRRLMSIVDDYGRHEANLQLLKSKCYPLAEQLKSSDISCWLDACKNAGLVTHYSVDGKSYLEIIKFQQQVRSKSKCPDPVLSSNCVADDEQLITNAHLGVFVFEGVSVGVDAAEHAPPKKRKPAKTLLPENFAISDAVREWAGSKGHSRLTEHLESFVSKSKAKAYEYADWDQAFMNAIRDDWANLGKTTSTKPRKMLGEGSSTNYGKSA